MSQPSQTASAASPNPFTIKQPASCDSLGPAIGQPSPDSASIPRKLKRETKMSGLLSGMYQKFNRKQQGHKYPGRKPRHLQWSAIDRFICGKCHTTFTTRYAQTRHMNNYHSPKNELKRELAMSKQKEVEKNKEERQRKREMKAQMIKKKNGRPPHPHH